MNIYLLKEDMIALPLNQDRDLTSSFTGALTGRRIDLDGENPDAVHLYTALSIGWRKGSEAATALLRELKRLQATSPSAKTYDGNTIALALRVFIYSATEIFDLYNQTIPKRLERARCKSEIKLIRDYQAVVKRLRDPVAKMCNLMKHDHREISTCRIVSESTGDMTFVYRINVSKRGVQLPDQDVHGKTGFSSIEKTFHEILHGLLRADYRAAELVHELSDNCNLAISLKGATNLGLAGIFEGLGRNHPIIASSESGRFDGVQVAHNEVVVMRIRATKVLEPTIRMFHAVIDEVAPSVQAFL
jgi:hypothetical protein